ncbi:hypothetical protein AB0O34_15210 [Sphaerisporangium sp. NPDC088356]
MDSVPDGDAPGEVYVGLVPGLDVVVGEDSGYGDMSVLVGDSVAFAALL